MNTAGKGIAYSCLAMLVALYVVGAVSHGVLRHIVQTLPLWFPIVLGLRGREFAKWTALPCMMLWLPIMILIWLFVLGWSRTLTGHFSPTEIAMTIVVGLACVHGIVVCLRWRTKVRPWTAAGTVALFAALQVLALRGSMIPSIGTR